MPLLSPEQSAAGISPGGEGAQWPRGPVAVSPADPNFLLLPIDVGGLYRSLDGGAHWEIALVGWDARGANGFAIDPKNSSRVIGIAANSMNWDRNWGAPPHGLYLSTDKARSWKHVLALPGGFGGTAAFDESSFDAEKGYCTAAYYLSSLNGMFESGDGGATWASSKNAPDPGQHKAQDWSAGVSVHPKLAIAAKTGAIYVGGANGLFRSTEHGKTWSRIREAAIYSLALAPDGTVFVSGAEGLSSSKDTGQTWTPLACVGLDTRAGQHIQHLAISPADPRRMLCWTSGKFFNWPRYVTWDGGATWQVVRHDRDRSILPANGREGYATWSPSDPNVAWSIGGDWVVKSADGGKSFQWSNNGYNGVMAGGFFNFSIHEPRTVFIGFQDYNGAFTTDGGKTWNYRDVSGKGWGGHEYGAFALNRDVMWSGDADSWGAPRRLRITRDGGKTWAFVNGPDGKPLAFKGPDVSCGDPADAAVGFIAKYRTADAGKTWLPMDHCDAVFTFDPQSRALLGKYGSEIVRSSDHGATWEKVAAVEGGFGDLACAGKRLYAASQGKLKAWEAGVWTTLDTPADQFGNVMVSTVAVDPQDSAVLYVGGPRNLYASKATVCRSTDGGKTWRNLTVTTPLGAGVMDGPHEVSAIRVHPATREAWVAGQCYGLWRIAAPKPGETGQIAHDASAPRAVPASKGY